MGMVATLVLAGCYPTEPLPTPEQQLVVHAVLDPGTREQLVQLSRAEGNAGAPLGIHGASVTLTGPDGRAMLASEDSIIPQWGEPSVYRYRVSLDDYGATLEPGATYSLRITLPEGHTASGTTTVPDASPAAPGVWESFIRASDTLRLSWPRVPRAAGYFVSIVGQQQRFYDAGGPRYSGFADTSLTLAGTARTIERDQVFVPGDSITVLVVAVDENFDTYYRPFVDPFAGAPPSRITGALGVFGSIVPIVAQRYVVR